MRTLIIFLFLLFSFTSQAALFKNAYVSFELPPNWSCQQEGFEHTCINKFEKKKKTAIIILTAKKRGPQDTLANYQAHIKKPKNSRNWKGVPYTSKVKVVKKRKINGVDWIDGIQLGSEVQTYYTRYTAAVTGQLGILVTFSAHKDHYSKFSQDFMKAIQSLKVVASKDLANFKSGSVRGKKRDLFAGGLSDVMPEGMYGDLDENAGDSLGSGGGFFGGLFGKKGLIGMLLLLITGLGGFIYMKSR